VQNEREDWDDLVGMAHEIWAVAQLGPGEGIVDGVDRIHTILATRPPAPEDAGTVERALRKIAAGTQITLENGKLWPSPLGARHSQEIALAALSRLDEEAGE
jgi:hypothetical protein